MDDNFSPRVKDVIAYSKEEALRLGHSFIGTEHLMLGMLRDGGGKAISILNAIEVDLEYLRQKVEIINPAVIDANESVNDKRNLHLTRQAERALKTTFLEAKLFQSELINTAHKEEKISEEQKKHYLKKCDELYDLWDKHWRKADQKARQLGLPR